MMHSLKIVISITIIFCLILTSFSITISNGESRDINFDKINYFNIGNQNKCAFSGIGNDFDKQIITPAINLNFIKSAKLVFYIQYGLNGLDRCYVHIKIDDGPWNEIDRFSGSQSSWIMKIYDLNEMIGHNIRIRFRYLTGLNSTSLGSVIDNIYVSGDNNIIYTQNFDDLSVGSYFGSWIIIEKSAANIPPYIPYNPNPMNGSINIEIYYDLGWSGGDPDLNDIVTYDIYFGKNTTPNLFISNQSMELFNPGILEYNTQYYWRIVSWDIYRNFTVGPLWFFHTEVNIPPFNPRNPNPDDGSFDIDINTELSWFGGDYNKYDNVVYDVYFDTKSDPNLMASNYPNTTFDPGTMNITTEYYWKIVAWDSNGFFTIGPIWYFKTSIYLNNPPNKPMKPIGPNSGFPLISYSYSSSTIDPTNDRIYYLFDWDDGSTSGWIGPYESGQIATASHFWNVIGSYSIKVKAKDEFGSESVWSDPLAFSNPRNKEINNCLLRLVNLFPIFKNIL